MGKDGDEKLPEDVQGALTKGQKGDVTPQKNSDNSETSTKTKDNIPNSEGIMDDFRLLFDAVTGKGNFSGSDDGLLRRMGIALGKSSGIMQALTTAGILGAVTKIVVDNDDDDDDDEDDKASSKVKNATSKLEGKLKKKKVESETLASRISESMKNQNISNNLSGSNFAVKNLAMISIKTQESLLDISNFIQENNLTTISYLKSIKESIDDIETNSGSVFQSLFPLLISGIVVAIGGSFLKNGFIDLIYEKVESLLFKSIGFSEKDLIKDKPYDKLLNKLVEKLDEVFFKEHNENPENKDDQKSLGNLAVEISKLIKYLNPEEKRKGEDGKELKSVWDDLNDIASNTAGINENISDIKENLIIIAESLGFNIDKNKKEEKPFKKDSLFEKIYLLLEGISKTSKNTEESNSLLDNINKLTSLFVPSKKDGEILIVKKIKEYISKELSDIFSKLAPKLIKAANKIKADGTFDIEEKAKKGILKGVADALENLSLTLDKEKAKENILNLGGKLGEKVSNEQKEVETLRYQIDNAPYHVENIFRRKKIREIIENDDKNQILDDILEGISALNNEDREEILKMLNNIELGNNQLGVLILEHLSKTSGYINNTKLSEEDIGRISDVVASKILSELDAKKLPQ